MGIKGVLDTARARAASCVAKLRRALRRPDTDSGGLPGTRDASAPPGEDAEARSGDDFPGFAPPPSLGDRIAGRLSLLSEKLRKKPRSAAIAGVCLAAACAVALALALASRPPKPITPERLSDPAAAELLRLIPVPLVDPLEQGLALDRPRKDRYTDADVAGKWMDLSALPTAELEEKNRAELSSILSAMEKPR